MSTWDEWNRQQKHESEQQRIREELERMRSQASADSSRLKEEQEKARQQNNLMNAAILAEQEALRREAAKTRKIEEQRLQAERDLRDARERQAQRRQAMFALSRAMGEAEKRFADDPLRLFQRLAMVQRRWEGLGFSEEDLAEIADKTYYAETADRIRDSLSRLRDTAPDVVETGEEYNRMRLAIRERQEREEAVQALAKQVGEIKSAPERAIARRDALVALFEDVKRWSVDYPGLLHVVCWLVAAVALGLTIFTDVLPAGVGGLSAFVLFGLGVAAKARGKKYVAKSENQARLKGLQTRMSALGIPEKDLAEGGLQCRVQVEIQLKSARVEAAKPLDTEALAKAEAELAAHREALESVERQGLEDRLRELVAVHPALGEWDEAAREFQALPVPSAGKVVRTTASVVIENAGDSKAQIIKALREAMPELDLLQAKNLVAQLPCTIDRLPPADARKLVETIIESGGRAHVED